MLHQSASAPSISHRSSSSRWSPPSNRWQHVSPVSHGPLRRPVSYALPQTDAVDQILGATTFPPARPINAPQPIKQNLVPWSSKTTKSTDAWRQNALKEIERLQAHKGACGRSGVQFATTLSKTANLESITQFQRHGDTRGLRRAVRAAAFLGTSTEPEVQRGQAILEKVDKMSVACHEGLEKADTTQVWHALEVTRGLDLGIKKWDDPWLAKGLEDSAKRWNLAGIEVLAEKRKPDDPPEAALDLTALSLAELRQECEKIPGYYWPRSLPPTGTFLRELRRRCNERGLLCNCHEWMVLMMRIEDDIDKCAEAEAARKAALAARLAELAEAEARRLAEMKRLQAEQETQNAPADSAECAAPLPESRGKWNALREKWKDAKVIGKTQSRWAGLQARLTEVTDPGGRKAAARKNWDGMKERLKDMAAAREDDDSDGEYFPDTDQLELELESGADPDSLIGGAVWMGIENDLISKGVCASHAEAEGWVVDFIEHFLTMLRDRDLHRYAVTPNLARSNVYG